MRAVHGGSLDLSEWDLEPIHWGRFRQAALRSDRTTGRLPTVPDGGGQEPITPPPFFMITTTDGRGGMPSLKSGQRVVGFSKVET
jgi:hypothetical protein